MTAQLNPIRIGIYFAEQLGRHRALSSEESGFVARLVSNDVHRSVLKRWRRAEDTRLLTLTRDGATAQQVAKDLGRTTSAVRSRIRQIKRRAHPPAIAPVSSKVV